MKYSNLEIQLDILKSLIRGIDRQLDEIGQIAEQNEDADSLGYFDIGENLAGLGFVACQTYMSAVYGHFGIDKRYALGVGPLHHSGQTKVQLINHAANYWKHRDEWSLDLNSNQKKAIESAFESAGFPITLDYPLSGILSEVASSESGSFNSVIAAIELWKETIMKAA